MRRSDIARLIGFVLAAGGLAAATHVTISKVILGERRPGFLSPVLIGVYLATLALFAVAYLLLVQGMTMRERLPRGLVFMVLAFSSAWLPQVVGLAGGDGAIVAQAFSIRIVVSDSLVGLLAGLVLGPIMGPRPTSTPRPAGTRSLVLTSLTSALSFPCLVMAADGLMRVAFPAASARIALGVSAEKAAGFHLVFYGCFALTGALLPLFYRLTKYNEATSGEAAGRRLSGLPSKVWQFGLIYACLIWTPVVMFMVAFGVDLVTNVVYALVFLPIVLAVTTANGLLLERLNAPRTPANTDAASRL
jgi:hypothetical protein